MKPALNERDGLAVLLPALRRRAGLTQQRLADALGCSLPTVHRLEAGDTPPTLQRLFQLSDVLGMPGGELAALVDGAEALGLGGSGAAAWLDQLAWAPGEDDGGQRPLLMDERGHMRTGAALESLPPATRTTADTWVWRRLRTFGLVLVELRQRLALSRAELAKAWGPSPSTIKRYEKGSASPDISAIRSLGALLGFMRGEIVALVEDLAHLMGDELSRARTRAQILVAFTACFDERLRWVPNPGSGLLPSRPSGFRLALVAADAAERETPVTPPPPKLPPGKAPGNRPARGPEGSRQALRFDLLVGPAAARLATTLLKGYGAVAAHVPWMSGEGTDIVREIADELLANLAEAEWSSSPALLVRQARPDQRSPGDEGWGAGALEGGFVVVSPERAQELLARPDPGWGPWRLVVVDGIAAANAAGLQGRQPSSELFGAGLVVIETDIATQRPELVRLTGRKLEFEYTCVKAMDAGLLPSLRFHGVADPVGLDEEPDRPGRPLPQKDLTLDDRRLEALAEAGALGVGVFSVVHVVSEDQKSWVEDWLSRTQGSEAAWIEVARKSVQPLELDVALHALVLLEPEYPKRLVQQVAVALGVADIDTGLDVWELESRDPDTAQKRRQGLAAALGVREAYAADGDEATRTPTGQMSWTSPGGGCSLQWTEPTVAPPVGPTAEPVAHHDGSGLLAEDTTQSAPQASDVVLRQILASRSETEAVATRTVRAEVLPVGVDPTKELATIAAQAHSAGLQAPILWLTGSAAASNYGLRVLGRTHPELEVVHLSSVSGPGPAQVVVASTFDLKHHLRDRSLWFDPSLLLFDGFQCAFSVWRLDELVPMLNRTPVVALASPLDGRKGTRFLDGFPVEGSGDAAPLFAQGQLAAIDVWLVEGGQEPVGRRPGSRERAESLSDRSRLAAAMDPRLPRVDGRAVFFCDSAEHLRVVADQLVSEKRTAIEWVVPHGQRFDTGLLAFDAGGPADDLCLVEGLSRFDPVPPVAQVVFLAPLSAAALEARLLPFLRASRGGFPVQVVQLIEHGDRPKTGAWRSLMKAAGRAGRLNVLPRRSGE